MDFSVQWRVLQNLMIMEVGRMDTKIDRTPSLTPAYGKKEEKVSTTTDSSPSTFQTMIEQKLDEIGRAQVAYKQYQDQGRTDLAADAHRWAEYQRQTLQKQGVPEEGYKQGVDLSARFIAKHGRIQAGMYDPIQHGETFRADYKQWAAQIGVTVVTPPAPQASIQANPKPNPYEKSVSPHSVSAAKHPGKTLQSAPKTVQGWIEKAAKTVGVNPNLLAAIAKQESGFNQNEYSSDGAIGLFQLMPSTAHSLGVNPHDPFENTLGGAKYIKDKLNKYNDVKLALAAYNAGPGRVDQTIRHVGSTDWKLIESHLPKQTQGFVRKVMSYYG
jgi:soluble lytic murein transglycosylase-like protein